MLSTSYNDVTMSQRESRSTLGSDLLPQNERELFVEQFEIDERFFQLVARLLNRSCPIKNVDLVWVERDLSGQPSVRRLGMAEATDGSGSAMLCCGGPKPGHAYCELINGDGRSETEACGISGAAAEELIRLTSGTRVYPCPFGLTNIAVPVTVNGQTIAALFTGQVLREPPGEEGFAEIGRNITQLGHVDVEEARHAYWRLPVVSEEDIQSTVAMLEEFAGYIAHAWLRSAAAVRERRGKERELRLARKEFAYYVLEGEGASGDLSEIRDLVRRVGFTSPPNRVMVVSFDLQNDGRGAAVPLEPAIAAAKQAVEDACEKLDNVVVVHLQRTGICVFFHDPPLEGNRAGEFYAHRLANRLLHAVRKRCELPARIGVGSPKGDWSELAQSYREACSALAASPGVVATYREAARSLGGLSQQSEHLCRLVAERKLDEAKAGIRSLPGLVAYHLGSDGGGLNSARLFYCCALESLCFAARDLGCEADGIVAVGRAANDDFQHATDALQLQVIWLRSAARILEEIGLLYSGKRRKIVERACLMIDQRLRNGSSSEHLSIATVASALGVSPSHMSRMFKRETGQTFESYVVEQRVGMAKRLLLDPLHNVSQVARKCGFSDASYFARVFRKVVGCSPSDYSHDPLRHCGPRA